MSKTRPENPILPEHEEKFEEYIQKWREKLNLADWRIVKKRGRPKDVLAEMVDFETEHRLVRYRVGRDAGVHKVTDELLEMTAIHELLHVVMHVPLEVAADEGCYNERVMAAEHAVINVLEALLFRLAQLEQIVIDSARNANAK